MFVAIVGRGSDKRVDLPFSSAHSAERRGRRCPSYTHAPLLKKKLLDSTRHGSYNPVIVRKFGHGGAQGMGGSPVMRVVRLWRRP